MVPKVNIESVDRQVNSILNEIKSSFYSGSSGIVVPENKIETSIRSDQELINTALKVAK